MRREKKSGLEETSRIIHSHICDAFREGVNFSKEGKQIVEFI